MRTFQNRLTAGLAATACASLWAIAFTIAPDTLAQEDTAGQEDTMAPKTAGQKHQGMRHSGMRHQEGMRHQGMQAMQEREFRNLQQGRGMGMGRMAEANGYPGPMHVLQHADALELNDAQIERSRELMTRVKTRAPELGKQVVEAERQLEAMFTEGGVDAARMNSLLTRIADLRAQLRSLHLTAHLDQAAVLDETQLGKYKKLRSAAQAEGERRPMRPMREMKQEGATEG